MFYLPRICEHCLNPSCVASCPSGAMYKREEDGIVLVDQEQCRSWRMCVSGCPYKKVYFNWSTGKAEKCTLCYPRIEAGQPTICSETCVGKIRYLGVVLYDADRVQEAASVARREGPAPGAALAVPRPGRPRGSRAGAARRDRRGLARRRAPLAGLRARGRASGRAAAPPGVPDAADGLVRAAALAGDEPRRGAGLGGRPGRRLPRDRRAPHPDRVPREHAHGGRPRAGPRRAPAARRDARLDPRAEPRRRARRRRSPRSVGMEPADIDAMFRLLAIAKYDERYVIPQTHGEIGDQPALAPGRVRPRLRGRPGELRRDRADARTRSAPSRSRRRRRRPPAARTSRSSTSGGAREREAPRRPARLPGRGARSRRSRSCAKPLRELPRARAPCARARPRGARCDPARRASPRATSRRSTSTAGAGSTSRTTPTATGGSAGSSSCGSSAATPRRGSRSRAPSSRTTFRSLLEFAVAAAGGGDGSCSRRSGRRSSSIRAALHDRGSLYAGVLDALCQALRARPRDSWTRRARLAEEGPPAELVGLEPVRRAPELAGAEAMSRADTFLWVLLPYVALTSFVVGHVWRYRRDGYTWTARSTQLLERRLLLVGSLAFHFGILGVIGGHVIGILVPDSWTRAVGISDGFYHWMAVIVGRRGRASCSASAALVLRLPASQDRPRPRDDAPQRLGDVPAAPRHDRARDALHVRRRPARRVPLPRDRVALVPQRLHLRPEGRR